MASKIFLTLSLLFITSKVVSQANLLNAKKPQEVGVLNEQQLAATVTKPLEYGFVDDRDVLWSKTIWEVIDLRKRINFPLYFPIDTVNLGVDRRSLFDVLTRSIRNGSITEVYRSSYFLEKITYDDILEALQSRDTLDEGFNQLNAGLPIDPQYIQVRNITPGEIKQYRIKGTWYFNKRLGELKYRILGIAPVAPDVYTLDSSEEEQDLVELFWVWYPDTREALNDATVFNRLNSARPITFDFLLNSRRFDAVIYKEENPYEDREIREYIKNDALLQLLESEKIKDQIREFEMNMWNH